MKTKDINEGESISICRRYRNHETQFGHGTRH